MADKDFRVKLGLHVGANAYIEGNITSVDRVQMNVASPAAVGGAGQFAWNIDENTLDLGMSANTTLQIGQEQYYYVKNVTGTTIPNRTVVMVAGTNGASGRIHIAPALANNAVPSKYIMGVTTEAIADGADGFVTAFGKVRNVDTSMFSEGDILYADPGVPGGLSNTAPVAPNNIVTVAFVVNKHANNGTLFVRPTYGSSVFEDEKAYINNIQDGQTLVYVSANSRFENKTVSTSGGDASNAWVNANDYATLLSARSNDYTTYLAAQSNDYATLLSARSNDYSTLLTTQSNDWSTLQTALANDSATLLSARANDFTTFLSASANDYSTYTTLNSRIDTTNSNVAPLLKAVTTVADATSITPNADTSSMVVQVNTQAAGTLTVNAPTGTITNGQKLMFRFICTNAQTLSWNAAYAGSTDLPLPSATTGSSKADYVGVIYDTNSSKWHLIAKNFGF
jgi:hypothetical protein